MKLYKLTVPIANYYNDGIFFQDMFIMSERCPSHLNWRELAYEYHNRDKQFQEYTNDWKQVYDILEIYVIPRLTGNLAQTNIFVRTGFGDQPLTISQQYYKELK